MGHADTKPWQRNILAFMVVFCSNASSQAVEIKAGTQHKNEKRCGLLHQTSVLAPFTASSACRGAEILTRHAWTGKDLAGMEVSQSRKLLDMFSGSSCSTSAQDVRSQFQLNITSEATPNTSAHSCSLPPILQTSKSWVLARTKNNQIVQPEASPQTYLDLK